MASAVLVSATLALTAAAARAQDSVERIPLVTGLALGSVFHSPLGEREDLLEIVRADAQGVHYAWHERTISPKGDTTTGFRKRFVRASDLAGAPRFNSVFGPDEIERPGFTAVSLSSAVYWQLRDGGTVSYSLMKVSSATTPFELPLSGAGVEQRYKGTLARASGPESFPLLVNGRRAVVPALHLQGTFAEGLRRTDWQVWVLADSAHPLLLKSLLEGEVFQLVRADLPIERRADRGGVSGDAERELAKACRLELPGVYFAFGTAAIDPISDRALAQVADVIKQHPDWTFTVEGHTDSIGTPAANQALSQRRAEAVRARLAQRHQVNTDTWRAAGYGASRPRESNATIEGRARNRRVELVRDCAGRRSS